MKNLVVVRPCWALLPLVLGLLWTPASPGAIHLGDIVVTNIGHTFQLNTNGTEGVTTDWLIDQGQFSDASGRLSPITTNLTSEDTFTLKVSAPAGMKFWIRPPRSGYVVFSAAMNWQFNLATYGQTVYGASLDVAFQNRVGISSGVSSGGHHDPTTARLGFGLFAPTFTEFTFTSITFTAKVGHAVIAGPEPVMFLPRLESALKVYAYSPSDIGPSISLVPIEQPVNAMVSLTEALDTDGTPFIWSTIGDDALPWNGRLFGSRDGTDVAESGPVTNGTAFTLQGKAVGPGTLSWWWKVSSETNHDYLKLFVDGVQQARISGEVDWQERSLHLDHGLHVLKWTYAKDSSGAAGADKGWLDQVRVVPDTNCLFHLNLAGRAHDVVAATGTVEVATSADCLWSVICTNSWIVALTPVLNRGTGTVTYAVSRNPGTEPRTGVLSIAGQSFVVTQPGGLTLEFSNPLQQALDVNDLDYWVEHGVGCCLFNQRLVTHDGVDAVQFGPLRDGGTASIHAGFIGPGTVSFWWKVSSETNLDNFKFSGPLGEERLSGETDWQYRSFRIGAGSWHCYWVYAKDGTFSVGNDRGWLDQLRFIPDIQGSVAISPANRAHGFGAETGSVNVTVNSGTWRAWTTSDWMYVWADVTNTTDGRVTYQLLANTTGQDRIGQIHIADQAFTIRQSNGVCITTVTPTHAVHGWQRATGTVAFATTVAGCPLGLTRTNNWIGFLSYAPLATGTRLDYVVAENPFSIPRTGWVTSADGVFEIVQAGNPDAPHPDPPLNLRILSYTRTDGVTLQIQGPRLETNIVQVSSNLVHWTPISTNQMPDTVCPTCPYLQIFDHTATNASRRFYRALQK